MLFFFVACNDDPDPTPTELYDIIGSVNLYDDGINPVDNSGMTISTEGTSQSFSATSDTNGDFILSDVISGTYSLCYEKSGYGAYKLYDVDHNDSGSNTIISNTPSLGKISTTEITDLTVDDTGADIIITVTTDPGGNSNSPIFIRYFFNSEPGVSNTAYAKYSDGLQISINPHDKTFTKSDLNELGFASGTTVYVRVYGDSFYSNEYDDPALYIRIFPNLNVTAADEVSFVVP